MNVTIIGSSDAFARGIATWATAVGHHITIVGPSRAQAEDFVAQIGSGQAAGPREPLRDNVIVVAMPYMCVLDARDSYGQQLDGRIVIDVTTPLDFGYEPVQPDAGSVAEELVSAGNARVVKAFHPRFSIPSVLGRHAADTPEVFLAGDDEDAKRVVKEFFEHGGLRSIDVGPLRSARDLETMGTATVTAPHGHGRSS